jgi:hypothetical protein
MSPRKRTISSAVILSAVCAVAFAPAAHAGTITVGGGPGLVINDQAPSDPEAARATPYPAALNVTGLTGVVSKVTATIVDFNHTCPQDVDLLLVSPLGSSALLMGDGGDCSGAARPNATLTFDDTGQARIDCVDHTLAPAAISPLTGTYRPGEAGGQSATCGGDDASGESLPAPAPPGPYGYQLGQVAYQDPNGAWRLYATDDSTDDAGAIGGWSLSFTINPPTPAVPPLGTSSYGINGRPERGETLTFRPGAWTGAGSFAYQWLRGDANGLGLVPIPGATAATYTLTARDVGHTVSASMTVSNSGGSVTIHGGRLLIGPPRLSFVTARPQRVVKQRGVLLALRTNIQSSLKATGTIRIRLGALAVRLRTAKKFAPARKLTKLTLRLSSRDRAAVAKALAAGAKLKARVTVTATDVPYRGVTTARQSIALRA